MEIVYEDADLLVINKPPGLVVDRSTLEKPGRLIVHRLDKETSGLLVMAKTPEALKGLQKQFKERKVKKHYLALVHGLVETPRRGVCTIDKSIGRSPKGVGKFVVVEGGRPGGRRGRPSVTGYTVKKLYSWVHGREPNRDKLTLLDVEPRTGRTHQIRVHLKSIGHPVVGDKIYASRRQQKEDAKIIKRQFLHAYRLSFSHPRTGEWLTFELDLPEDLREVLDNLKCQNSKLKTTS